MRRNIFTRERVTTVASVIVAVAVVGALVTAKPSRVAQVDELTALWSGLTYQVQSSYRHDIPQRDQRLAAMRAAAKAWNASGQTAEDRRHMKAWVREAIARSMPGSSESLPDAPVFEPKAPAEVIAAAAPEAETPADTTPAMAHAEKPSPRAVAPDSVKQPVSKPDQQPAIASQEAYPAKSLRNESESLLAQGPEGLPNQTAAVDPASEPAAAPVASARPVVSRTLMPEIGLNLSKLAMRIALYHDLLDTLESELQESGSWDDRQAAHCSEMVDQALRDYQFISLYHGVLTPDESRRVLQPREPEPLVSKVRAEVDHWQTQADRDYLRPLDTSRGSSAAPVTER